MPNLAPFPGIARLRFCPPSDYRQGDSLLPFTMPDDRLARSGIHGGAVVVCRQLYGGERPPHDAVCYLTYGGRRMLARVRSAGENLIISDDRASITAHPADVTLIAVAVHTCRCTPETRCEPTRLLPTRHTAALFHLGHYILRWRANPDGGAFTVGQDWHDAFGSTPEDWQGGAWPTFIHGEDRERVLAAWIHSLSTGSPFLTEGRIMARGQYRRYVAAASPVYQNGRIAYWDGLFQFLGEERRRA